MEMIDFDIFSIENEIVENVFFFHFIEKKREKL